MNVQQLPKLVHFYIKLEHCVEVIVNDLMSCYCQKILRIVSSWNIKVWFAEIFN